MNSLILRIATRYLVPLLLLASLAMLFVGHNHPGGGFIAGLLSAGAFALYLFAHDLPVARRALRVNPLTLIGLGLFVAFGSGSVALISGLPFMAGRWITVPIPLIGELHLGTPLLFDCGVYLVVIGVTLNIIFSLSEEA